MARGVLPLLAICLVLVLPACERPSRELRVHSRDSQAFDPTVIQAVFHEQSILEMESAGLPRGTPCLEALADGSADLCWEDNSAPFVRGVRAVLPVHKSVLHVFMRDGFNPVDPARPLQGASVHVIDGASTGLRFLQLVADRQNLAEGDYQLFRPGDVDKADLIFYMGPIDPQNTAVRFPDYQIISMDKRLGPGQQFTPEGVQHALSNIEPAVIPAFTYDVPGNEQAVHTIAVDALLLTRKAVAAPVIFELTRTLVQQKPRFRELSPAYFAGITESFDPLSLNFPLHQGARWYLERDEPGLLERYAETINMLAYLTVMLLSGFIALARWRARRKKDRIDVFYLKVMDIRKRAGEEDPRGLQAELLALEQEAFHSLVREKLAADESFRIFTDLAGRVQTELAEETERRDARE